MPEINDNNFLETIVDKFMSNKPVKNKIKEFMLKALENEETFISLFLKMVGWVYDKCITDFQELFEIFVKKYYCKMFSAAVNKLENDGILTTMLLNKSSENDILMELFDKYLSEMSIDSKKVNSNIQSNNVNVILGLNVPKVILDWLFGTNIKEKVDDLNGIDNSIRNDYDDSEKTLEQYSSDKKLLFENIFQEVNKNMYFNKLIEKHFFNDENYNKIKRDYYKIFIIKNVVMNCDLTPCEDILDFILEKVIESN